MSKIAKKTRTFILAISTAFANRLGGLSHPAARKMRFGIFNAVFAILATSCMFTGNAFAQLEDIIYRNQAINTGSDVNATMLTSGQTVLNWASGGSLIVNPFLGSGAPTPGAAAILGDMTTIYFQNFNSTTLGGGAIHVSLGNYNFSGSRETIVDDTWNLNTTGGNDWRYSTAPRTAWIDFNYNSATHGGAIYLGGGGTLTFQRVTFHGNTAVGGLSQGGAVYVASNGTLRFNSDVEYSQYGGTFPYDGRNLVSLASSARLTALQRNVDQRYASMLTSPGFGRGLVRFSDNAAREGGAIYNTGTITGMADFICNGVNSTSSAVVGGAIYNLGTLTRPSGTYVGNQAISMGGAIFNETNATITEIGGDSGARGPSHFLLNKVTGSDGLGGAIFNQVGGTVSVKAANFEENSAQLGLGGAIYNHGSLLLSTGVIFSENFAMEGGAVYNSQNGTLNQSTGTSSLMFQYNKATSGSGGGVYTAGDIYLNNVRFVGNEATQFGGALFADGGFVQIQDGVFTNNSALRGGALYNNQYGEIDLTDVQFNTNTADMGGAIFNSRSGSITIAASSGKTNIFQNNHATVDGGAFYNASEGTIMVTNASILGNTADRDGGAFYNEQNGSLPTSVTLTDVTLSRNKATGNGGAISNMGGIIEISNTLNNTINYNEATVNGGAIYNANGGEITLTNISFIGNKVGAGGLGGAIYNSSATINIIADNATPIVFGDVVGPTDSIYFDGVDNFLNVEAVQDIITRGGLFSANDSEVEIVKTEAGTWRFEGNSLFGDSTTPTPVKDRDGSVNFTLAEGIVALGTTNGLFGATLNFGNDGRFITQNDTRIDASRYVFRLANSTSADASVTSASLPIPNGATIAGKAFVVDVSAGGSTYITAQGFDFQAGSVLDFIGPTAATSPSLTGNKAFLILEYATGAPTTPVDVMSDFYVTAPVSMTEDQFIVLMEVAGSTFVAPLGIVYDENGVAKTFERFSGQKGLGLSLYNSDTQIILKMVGNGHATLEWTGIDRTTSTPNGEWRPEYATTDPDYDPGFLKNWSGTIGGPIVYTFAQGDTVTFGDSYMDYDLRRRVDVLATNKSVELTRDVEVRNMFVTGAGYEFKLGSYNITAVKDAATTGETIVDFGTATITFAGLVDLPNTITADKILFGEGGKLDFTAPTSDAGWPTPNPSFLVLDTPSEVVVGGDIWVDSTIMGLPNPLDENVVLIEATSGGTLGMPAGKLYVDGSVSTMTRTTDGAGAPVIGFDRIDGNTKLVLTTVKTNHNGVLTWTGNDDLTTWNQLDKKNWIGSVAGYEVDVFLNNDTVRFVDVIGGTAIDPSKKTVAVMTGGVTVADMNITGTDYVFNNGRITSNTGKLTVSSGGSARINVATQFAKGIELSTGAHLTVGHNDALGVTATTVRALGGQSTITGATDTMRGQFFVSGSNSALTINTESGKNLTVNNGSTFNVGTSGSLTFAPVANSTMTINAPTEVTSGQLVINGDGTVVYNGDITAKGYDNIIVTGTGDKTINGIIDAGDSTLLAVDGTGAKLFTGDIIFDKNNTVEITADNASFTGEISMDSDNVMTIGGGQTTFSGLLVLSGNDNLIKNTGGTLIFNGGFDGGVVSRLNRNNNLTTIAGKTVVNSVVEGLDQVDIVGGKLEVNNRISALNINITGANSTVGGHGTLAATNGVKIGSGATIDPSNAAASLDYATLTFDGDLFLDGANFIIDIVGNNWDQLVVQGTLTTGEKSMFDVNNIVYGETYLVIKTNRLSNVSVSDFGYQRNLSTEREKIEIIGNDIYLTVNLYTPDTLIWTGNTNGVWNTTVENNWKTADTDDPIVFDDDLYDVVFNQEGKNTNPITIENPVSVHNMTIEGGSYRFTGSKITGGELIGTGGRTTIGVETDFLSGTTLKNNATFVLEHNKALGVYTGGNQGMINVTGGKPTIETAKNVTVQNKINTTAGSTLTLAATGGTLAFSGVDSYSVIDAKGSLVINTSKKGNVVFYDNGVSSDIVLDNNTTLTVKSDGKPVNGSGNYFYLENGIIGTNSSLVFDSQYEGTTVFSKGSVSNIGGPITATGGTIFIGDGATLTGTAVSVGTLDSTVVLSGSGTLAGNITLVNVKFDPSVIDYTYQNYKVTPIYAQAGDDPTVPHISGPTTAEEDGSLDISNPLVIGGTFTIPNTYTVYANNMTGVIITADDVIGDPSNWTLGDKPDSPRYIGDKFELSADNKSILYNPVIQNTRLEWDPGNSYGVWDNRTKNWYNTIGSATGYGEYDIFLQDDYAVFAGKGVNGNGQGIVEVKTGKGGYMPTTGMRVIAGDYLFTGDGIMGRKSADAPIHRDGALVIENATATFANAANWFERVIVGGEMGGKLKPATLNLGDSYYGSTYLRSNGEFSLNNGSTLNYYPVEDGIIVGSFNVDPNAKIDVKRPLDYVWNSNETKVIPRILVYNDGGSNLFDAWAENPKLLNRTAGLVELDYKLSTSTEPGQSGVDLHVTGISPARYADLNRLGRNMSEVGGALTDIFSYDDPVSQEFRDLMESLYRAQTNEEVTGTLNQMRGPEMVADMLSITNANMRMRTLFDHLNMHRYRTCLPAARTAAKESNTVRGQTRMTTRDVWVQMLYNGGSIGADNNARKFTTDRSGLVVGMDKKLNSFLTVGANFNYSNPRLNSMFGKVEGDDWALDFYFQRQIDCDWYVNAMIGYGHQEFRMNRHEAIAIPGYDDIQRYKSEYAGNTLAVSFEAVRPFKTLLGTLLPFAGLDYNQGWTGSFQETGDGAFKQAISGASKGAMIARAGATAIWTLEDCLDVTFRMQFGRQLLGRQYGRINSTFVGGSGYEMTLRGVDMGQDFFALGVGGRTYWTKNKGLYSFAQYDANMNKRGTLHAAQMGVVVLF